MLNHFRLSSISETATICGLDLSNPEFERAYDWTRDDSDLWLALPEADRCRDCARRLARELGLPVVYVIPEENKADVEKKVEALNRRAVKLGVSPITISWAHDHTQTWKVERVEGSPEYGYNEFARQWLACTVEGAAVRIAGYAFLATLHHTTDGNIIAAVPGRDVPREFRNAPSACGHCRTTRTRSATYLLEELATGRVTQVGRDCLQDFLGNDPHKLGAWAEMLGAFASWFIPMEDEGHRPRTEWAFSLEHFLGAVAGVIRMDGWVSKKRAQESNDAATASTSWGWLTVLAGTKTEREMTARYGTEPDADRATVALVIEWATKEFGEETTRTDLNDYEHNLSVVVRSGLVSQRVAGLAASLIQAWRRATQVAEERKAAADAPPSEHVGTVGERLRDVPVTIKAVIPMPPTEFGPRELVKMADDAGNVFAWFTGALGSWTFPLPEGIDGADAEEAVKPRSPVSGDRMWLTGTVKKHSSFQGSKQTELSRCALASYAPAPKKGKKEATA